MWSERQRGTYCFAVPADPAGDGYAGEGHRAGCRTGSLATVACLLGLEEHTSQKCHQGGAVDHTSCHDVLCSRNSEVVQIRREETPASCSKA